VLKELVVSARVAAKKNDPERARLADQTLQVIIETRLTASGRSFVCCETKQVQFTPRTRAVKPFRKVQVDMTAIAPAPPRFVRRTQLGANEYRKNFRQIDGDVIAAVTSQEADRVTPLMSKIYLRLVHAPARYWERDGVLRFEGELRDDGQVTAWEALCEVVGVASATARKALLWMHGQGIIGYFAGKNGVGIRVFLNRAMNSIGTRAAGQKILEFPPASSAGARASRNEAAFNDSYAVSEVLEIDLSPRAPKSGAVQTKVIKKSSAPHPTPVCPDTSDAGVAGVSEPRTALRLEVPVEEIVSRLKSELEPTLQSAARQAATREHERTREWLESRGLPKAARVAQREAFNVLRRHGLFGADTRRAAAGSVGLNDCVREQVRPLSPEEIKELAESCVAMLEVHGRAIDVTLSELSAEAGGILLAEDAPRVRELAESMNNGGSRAPRG
jgi:hypothetical protein